MSCVKSQSRVDITQNELLSLLGLKESDLFAMLYRAFIDDSADERQKTIMVAATFLASHAQWKQLRYKWKKRLSQDGLRYFRSTEYYSLTGEFHRFKDPNKYPKPMGSRAASTLRDDLERIIEDSGIAGLSMVVPIQTYRHVLETVKGADSVFNADVFSCAMQILMVKCAEFLDHEAPGSRIAFVCDESPHSAKYALVYADFKLKNPVAAEMMGGLVHLDDKKHPPLQAADLLANLAKEVGTRYLQDAEQITLSRLEKSVWHMYMASEDVLVGIVHANLARAARAIL